MADQESSPRPASTDAKNQQRLAGNWRAYRLDSQNWQYRECAVLANEAFQACYKLPNVFHCAASTCVVLSSLYSPAEFRSETAPWGNKLWTGFGSNVSVAAVIAAQCPLNPDRGRWGSMPL